MSRCWIVVCNLERIEFIWFPFDDSRQSGQTWSLVISFFVLLSPDLDFRLSRFNCYCFLNSDVYSAWRTGVTLLVVREHHLSGHLAFPCLFLCLIWLPLTVIITRQNEHQNRDSQLRRRSVVMTNLFVHKWFVMNCRWRRPKQTRLFCLEIPIYKRRKELKGICWILSSIPFQLHYRIQLGTHCVNRCLSSLTEKRVKTKSIKIIERTACLIVSNPHFFQ